MLNHKTELHEAKSVASHGNGIEEAGPVNGLTLSNPHASKLGYHHRENSFLRIDAYCTGSNSFISKAILSSYF